jgi:hypothetical protein
VEKKDNLIMVDALSMDFSKGIKDSLVIVPNMKVELFDRFGNLKDQRDVHNTVTTAGHNGAADQILLSQTLAKPTHMALGTGSPGATLLGTEVCRVVLDSKTRGANSIVTMVCTFPAGTPAGSNGITEAGIFDVVTANTVNMWLSASFSVVNKGPLDSIVVTWTLTF